MASPVVDIVLRAKDEASRAINALGKSIGGLNSIARTLAPVAAGLGAIGGAAGLVGVAAFKMADDMSKTVERLDRLSGTTGATIQQLQILEQTFKNAGLAPETATLALAKLSKAIGNNDPLLKQLGVTTRDSFTALMQLSDIFEHSSDTAGKVSIAAKLLGRDMVQSASTIQNLGRTLDATGAKMKAAGGLIGDDGAAQARKMDAAMDDLNISMGGVKNILATAVIPAVAEFARRLAEAMVQNKEAIVGFVKASIEALDRMVIALPDRLNRLTLLWLQYRLIVAETALAVASGFGAVTTTLSMELNVQTVLISNQIDKLDKLISESDAKWKKVGTSPRTPAPAIDPATGAASGATIGAAPRLVPSGSVIDADGNLIAAKEDERAKRLREIQTLLRVSTADAQAFLRSLEAIEGAAKSEGLRVEVTAALIATAGPDLQRQLDALGPLQGPKVALREAGQAAGDTGAGAVAGIGLRGGISSQSKLPPISAPIDEEQIKAWQEQTRIVAESVAEIEGGIARVKDGWFAAVEQMTSAASILDAGFQAVFSGLESGISTVFSRLTDKTQTLRSAMATIFKSIADQALQELARIAAAELFKFVLKLLKGISSGGTSFVSDGIQGSVLAGARRVGPGLASAGRSVAPAYTINTASITRAITNVLGLRGGRPIGVASVARTVAPTVRINTDALAKAIASAIGEQRPQPPADQRTFNINAIDAHDIVASLLLPGGGMRRANDRLSIAGAY